MFRELVNCPIDPIPLEYVQSLNRIVDEPDYSLSCLGIAMLKPRIENYKGIDGCYRVYSEKAACVKDFIDRYRNINECPLFCYYKYSYSEGFDQAEIDTELGEFKEKKSISAFVKEKTGSDCLVLYHETKNAVAIMVNANDNRLYHLLLSFVSLYFPSLFKDNPLTENDYDLIKSLSKRDKDDFYACIKRMVEQYTIEFRRIQMCNFMKTMHEKKIRNANRDVSNQRDRVSNYEEQYVEAIRCLHDLIVIYEGLKATENYDKAEEDLVEYLAMNKDIHNLVIRDDAIYFTVTTLLSNYNEQAWSTFHDRGFIYDGEYGTRLTSDAFKVRKNREILLNNIFSDSPLLMVKMAGNYKLDLNRYTVSTSSGYDYVEKDPMFKDYIPNPHLALFACLGGYKDKVLNAMMEHNYIAAINLCIASAGSINLDETTQTFRPFLGWLLNSKDKVLVNRDGKEMTPEEALVWLIDNQKVEEQA